MLHFGPELVSVLEVTFGSGISVIWGNVRLSSTVGRIEHCLKGNKPHIVPIQRDIFVLFHDSVFLIWMS